MFCMFQDGMTGKYGVQDEFKQIGDNWVSYKEQLCMPFLDIDRWGKGILTGEVNDFK